MDWSRSHFVCLLTPVSSAQDEARRVEVQIWSVTPADGRVNLLTVYLADSRAAGASLPLVGKWAALDHTLATVLGERHVAAPGAAHGQVVVVEEGRQIQR